VILPAYPHNPVSVETQAKHRTIPVNKICEESHDFIMNTFGVNFSRKILNAMIGVYRLCLKNGTHMRPITLPPWVWVTSVKAKLTTPTCRDLDHSAPVTTNGINIFISLLSCQAHKINGFKSIRW
jgi:hypothetical protein